MEDSLAVEAALADPRRVGEDHASIVAEGALAALWRPHLLGRSTVSTCERLLQAPRLRATAYDCALQVMAAAVYARPDLIGDHAAFSLKSLFSRGPLPSSTYRLAGEIMNFLLSTRAAPSALAALTGLLSQPDRPPVVYEVLLESLQYAASWAAELLHLTDLVPLAECRHLSDYRSVLLENAIERCVFAAPGAITADDLDRLVRLYADLPSFKYCLYYLSECQGAAADVRRAAKATLGGRFPLHEAIWAHLGQGRRRLLVVQNIADAQGDEIIRVVPLIQAFLDFNPDLEITLVTGRAYLYAHRRIRLVPIDDRAHARALPPDAFDAVIDFFESDILEVNYDIDLERQLRERALASPPFLHLSARKGYNHIVYQSVNVASHPYAETLELDRQRVRNIYETTSRLIAELGLPLRAGEEPSEADPVLAGLPCREAEAAWKGLVEGSADGRPVALVNPFGGAEPLKGYIGRQMDKLAAQIRRLIAEGFYVVLLPNGTPWGSAARASRVRDHLEPEERAQVAIGPDPAAGGGHITYHSSGTLTVPHASYAMHLVTYFVRFADLVVTVEGWMMHAAYCLGKRYRVLMLPYSHPAEWHPYGRTHHQDVVQSFHSAVDGRRTVGPPLPAQPRKFILLFLLKSLSSAPDPRGLPLLRRALQSEDRHVRCTAAQSLGRFVDRTVDADLLALLDDSYNGVRAAAAGALLERMSDSTCHLDVTREELLAYYWIGEGTRDWGQVMRLGEAGRSAVEKALREDDPVVRREAAQVLSILDRVRPQRRRIRDLVFARRV